MTRDELRESVARAICGGMNETGDKCPLCCSVCLADADAAIAVVFEKAADARTAPTDNIDDWKSRELG